VRPKRTHGAGGYGGTDSDCLSAKKSAQKALEALKGYGGDGNRLPVRRKSCVVCMVRALSGWNVRLKRPKRLDGYTDFVSLAAKSFVSSRWPNFLIN
jgi:hypothetical protein